MFILAALHYLAKQYFHDRTMQQQQIVSFCPCNTFTYAVVVKVFNEWENEDSICDLSGAAPMAFSAKSVKFSIYSCKVCQVIVFCVSH